MAGLGTTATGSTHQEADYDSSLKQVTAGAAPHISSSLATLAAFSGSTETTRESSDDETRTSPISRGTASPQEKTPTIEGSEDATRTHITAHAPLASANILTSNYTAEEEPEIRDLLLHQASRTAAATTNLITTSDSPHSASPETETDPEATRDEDRWTEELSADGDETPDFEIQSLPPEHLFQLVHDFNKKKDDRIQGFDLVTLLTSFLTANIAPDNELYTSDAIRAHISNQLLTILSTAIGDHVFTTQDTSIVLDLTDACTKYSKTLADISDPKIMATAAAHATREELAAAGIETPEVSRTTSGQEIAEDTKMTAEAIAKANEELLSNNINKEEGGFNAFLKYLNATPLVSNPIELEALAFLKAQVNNQLDTTTKALNNLKNAGKQDIDIYKVLNEQEQDLIILSKAFQAYELKVIDMANTLRRAYSSQFAEIDEATLDTILAELDSPEAAYLPDMPDAPTDTTILKLITAEGRLEKSLQAQAAMEEKIRRLEATTHPGSVEPTHVARIYHAITALQDRIHKLKEENNHLIQVLAADAAPTRIEPRIPATEPAPALLTPNALAAAPTPALLTPDALAAAPTPALLIPDALAPADIEDKVLVQALLHQANEQAQQGKFIVDATERATFDAKLTEIITHYSTDPKTPEKTQVLSFAEKLSTTYATIDSINSLNADQLINKLAGLSKEEIENKNNGGLLQALITNILNKKALDHTHPQFDEDNDLRIRIANKIFLVINHQSTLPILANEKTNLINLQNELRKSHKIIASINDDTAAEFINNVSNLNHAEITSPITKANMHTILKNLERINPADFKGNREKLATFIANIEEIIKHYESKVDWEILAKDEFKDKLSELKDELENTRTATVWERLISGKKVQSTPKLCTVISNPALKDDAAFYQAVKSLGHIVKVNDTSDTREHYRIYSKASTPATTTITASATGTTSKPLTQGQLDKLKAEIENPAHPKSGAYVDIYLNKETGKVEIVKNNGADFALQTQAIIDTLTLITEATSIKSTSGVDLNYETISDPELDAKALAGFLQTATGKKITHVTLGSGVDANKLLEKLAKEAVALKDPELIKKLEKIFTGEHKNTFDSCLTREQAAAKAADTGSGTAKEEKEKNDTTTDKNYDASKEKEKTEKTVGSPNPRGALSFANAKLHRMDYAPAPATQAIIVGGPAVK